jgi:hypothetical protein
LHCFVGVHNRYLLSWFAGSWAAGAGRCGLGRRRAVAAVLSAAREGIAAEGGDRLLDRRGVATVGVSIRTAARLVRTLVAAALALALLLRTCLCGADAGPDPGLATDAAEQARLRLLENVELGVVGSHAELIECGLAGFVEGLCGGLYPLHG